MNWRLCGPRSIAFIFNELGIKVDSLQLLVDLGYTEDKGVTLLGLQECAIKNGLYACAIEAPIKMIIDIVNKNKNIYVIVHQYNHFFVLANGTHGVLTIDTEAKKIIPISDSYANSNKSLYALVISKSECNLPLNAPSWRGHWAYMVIGIIICMYFFRILKVRSNSNV